MINSFEECEKGFTVFMIFVMLDKKSLFVYAGDAENEEQAR